ncbi:hypothetical protein AYK61_00340 [Rhodococcus sp. SBT000017]|nr:hypothetical protein AYK61_00340 [Rhodococcus sp. SBT000017]
MIGSTKAAKADSEYQKGHQQLNRLLRQLAVPNPIRYSTLGEWGGRWRKGDLPKWVHRTEFVNALVADTAATLASIQESGSLVTAFASADPTWASLQDRVDGLARELEQARSDDDRQDVGRRAREILIDAATVIQDPDLVADGDDAPKAADAKEWIGLYLERYAAGGSHKALRQFVRATWDLAQRVTHTGIDHVEAYAAAQATVAVVRVLQLLETKAETARSSSDRIPSHPRRHIQIAVIRDDTYATTSMVRWPRRLESCSSATQVTMKNM